MSCPQMTSICTLDAACCTGHQQNAPHWNSFTTAMAQAKPILFEPIKCTKQISPLLLHLPKRSLVDAPVVDRIHSTNTSDGILRWNRLGKLSVFHDAFIQFHQFHLHLFLELCNFFCAPMRHIYPFSFKVRSGARQSKQFKSLILWHEIFH